MAPTSRSRQGLNAFFVGAKPGAHTASGGTAAAAASALNSKQAHKIDASIPSHGIPLPSIAGTASAEVVHTSSASSDKAEQQQQRKQAPKEEAIRKPMSAKEHRAIAKDAIYSRWQQAGRRWRQESQDKEQQQQGMESSSSMTSASPASPSMPSSSHLPASPARRPPSDLLGAPSPGASPLSVREDPDTGKLYLLISPRRTPAKSSGRSGSGSGAKRARAGDEKEGDEAEEEEGQEMMLTPGRNGAKRVRLGSGERSLGAIARSGGRAGHFATFNASPLARSSTGTAQLAGLGITSPSLDATARRQELPAVVLGEEDELTVSPEKVPYRTAGPLLSALTSPAADALASRASQEDSNNSSDDDLILTPKRVRAR